MYLDEATISVVYLVSLNFVVLSVYVAYVSSSFTSSGPIESTLDGVQGFLMSTSVYISSCVNWVGTFILLVLFEQEQGRHVWREWVFCHRLVVPGAAPSVRCSVLAWPFSFPRS